MAHAAADAADGVAKNGTYSERREQACNGGSGLFRINSQSVPFLYPLPYSRHFFFVSDPDAIIAASIPLSFAYRHTSFPVSSSILTGIAYRVYKLYNKVFRNRMMHLS